MHTFFQTGTSFGCFVPPDRWEGGGVRTLSTESRNLDILRMGVHINLHKFRRISKTKNIDCMSVPWDMSHEPIGVGWKLGNKYSVKRVACSTCIVCNALWRKHFYGVTRRIVPVASFVD